MLRTIAVGLPAVAVMAAVVVVAVNLVGPPKEVVTAVFFASCAAAALFGIWLDVRLHGKRDRNSPTS